MARVGTRRIAPAAGPSVFARIWKGWEKIGSILAILGLADIFGQTVKWAAGIHWVVSRYALAREWLFSWVPFRIPEEWHDPIVLLLVLFSVTNIGYYRHTGRTYTGQLLWFLGYMVWAVVSLPLAWIPSIKKKRNQLSKDLNYRQIYASDKIANGAAIAIFGLAMTIAFLKPTSAGMLRNVRF